MNGYYKVHEFAELAGVTVKALHHYDRLGLLKPGRTVAGYRRYVERDLERLEQIVALKFLGIPLKQIKAVLDRAELELPDALQMQRRAIEKKQALLCRALRAIQAAEQALEPCKRVDPQALKKIIEVISMQDGIEQMKKFYSDAAWEMRKRFYEEGPSPEWRELYREVGEMLGEDPGSAKAQAVAERWLALSARAHSGDLSVQTHSGTAWMEREHWPPAMKRTIAEFKLEEVHEFIRQTAICARKKYFSPEAWEKVLERGKRAEHEEDLSMWWQRTVDLFRDIEAALEDNPASQSAQSLLARWRERIDHTSDGDPAVKEGVLKGWSDRRNWPTIMRWQAEAIYQMSFERFLKAADYLDQAAEVMAS